MKRETSRLIPVLLLSLLAGCLLSGTAQAWWNQDWTLRKRITIDTTANAGGISDNIGTTQVLIRLADFNFGPPFRL